MPAMIFSFLAVKEVGLVDAVFACERTGAGGCQRDALISGAEHRVELIADGFFYEIGVVFAESIDLCAGLIVAGVDKIRGESSALGFELAEAQNVRAHHEFDKFLLFLTEHIFSPFWRPGKTPPVMMAFAFLLYHIVFVRQGQIRQRLL